MEEMRQLATGQIIREKHTRCSTCVLHWRVGQSGQGNNSPSMSSDTGVLMMSPVNSQVVCLASIPAVPSNTCKTQRSTKMPELQPKTDRATGQQKSRKDCGKELLQSTFEVGLSRHRLLQILDTVLLMYQYRPAFLHKETDYILSRQPNSHHLLRSTTQNTL